MQPKFTLKSINENLSLIILIPTLIGGIWQIFELSTLSFAYIRFFSITQLLADGILILFLAILIYFTLKASVFLGNSSKEETNRGLIIFKFIMTMVSCVMCWWIFFVEYHKSNDVAHPLLLISIGITVIMVLSAIHFFLIDLILKFLNSKFVREYLAIFIIIGLFVGGITLLAFILQVFHKEYFLPKRLGNLKNIECYVAKKYPPKSSFEIVYFNDKYFFVEINKSKENNAIEIIEFNELFKDNCK